MRNKNNMQQESNNSSTSGTSVGRFTEVVEEASSDSSSLLLTAFAAVAVGGVEGKRGEEDETCNYDTTTTTSSSGSSSSTTITTTTSTILQSNNKNTATIKYSSPSKVKTTIKNPSLCLTGTPSSEQRPSKAIRPNCSTPVKSKSANTSTNMINNGGGTTTTTIINETDEVSSLPLLPPNLKNSTCGEPLFAQMHNHAKISAIVSSTTVSTTEASASTYVTSITDEMKHRFSPNFKYKSAFAIKNGPAAGYKAKFSEEESICVKERIKGGILWKDLVSRFEDHRDSVTKGFNGPKMCGVEELIRYKCRTASCNCELIVARATGGIIVYEKMDLTTNEPYEHRGHDLPPDEQKGHRGTNVESRKSKYDGCSLTQEQKEYINQHCSLLMQKGDYHGILRSMTLSPSVTVLETQKSDQEMFSNRIQYYVKYLKRTGYGSLANRAMTGDEIQRILDCLKHVENTTIGRNNDLPFLQSTDFACMQERIRISDHDYQASGGVFSFISFEFVDAGDRAEKAVQRFGSAGVQGEMDFFHVPGVDADWQVGHIGFSDHVHRYHILCMIICHSENSTTAGMLVKRAVDLITMKGGRLSCLLVDGGTALNKAIGDENAQNQLLRGWSIQKRRCFAHIIRMVSHGRHRR